MRRRLATTSPTHPPAYYRAMAAVLDVEARMARLAMQIGKALAALRDARRREAEVES